MMIEINNGRRTDNLPVVISGGKYHSPGCGSIGEDARSATMLQALAEGCQPCADCGGGQVNHSGED